MKEKGQRIITLRKRGRTYGEIAKTLNLPKSTVAWWSKKAGISKSLERMILERSRKKWRQNIIEYNRIHAKIRSEKARIKREKTEKKASKQIKHISKSGLKLIGSALYWGEGNKKCRWYLRFANSDSLMVKVMMRFFRETCKIPDEKIKLRIHLYPNTNQKKATEFWSKITKLPKNNFLKAQVQISKASKRKRSRNTLPHGTLHIRAGNTKTTSTVRGWIRGITEKT